MSTYSDDPYLVQVIGQPQTYSYSGLSETLNKHSTHLSEIALLYFEDKENNTMKIGGVRAIIAELEALSGLDLSNVEAELKKEYGSGRETFAYFDFMKFLRKLEARQEINSLIYGQSTQEVNFDSPNYSKYEDIISKVGVTELAIQSAEILQSKWKKHNDLIESIIRNKQDNLVATISTILRKTGICLAQEHQLGIFNSLDIIHGIADATTSEQNPMYEEEEIDSQDIWSGLTSFLTANSKIIAIDGSNEMGIYDLDEFARGSLTNESNGSRESKPSGDPFEHNLLITISQYEDMKFREMKNGKNTANIQQLINSLTKQLDIYRGDEHLKTSTSNILNLSKNLSVGRKGGLPPVHRQYLKKKPVSDEYLFKKALEEIFIFYAKQSIMAGKQKTFENVSEELRTINMGQFNKIIKDFKIKISTNKMRELFKKTAKLKNTKYLLYSDNFEEMLKKLARDVHAQKKDDIDSDIKALEDNISKNNKEIKSHKRAQEKIEKEEEKILTEEEEKKDEIEEDGEVEFKEKEDMEEEKDEPEIKELPPKKKPVKKEKNVKSDVGSQAIIEKIEALEKKNASNNEKIAEKKGLLEPIIAKTDKEILLELYSYMGIDSSMAYKNKMQGFKRAGFGVYDPDTQRIPNYDLGKKYKYKERKELEEVKRNVLQQKIGKEQMALQKQREELEVLEKHRIEMNKKIEIQKEDLRRNKAKGKGLGGHNSYMDIRHKQMGLYNERDHQKLNWQVLGQLHYKDINQDMDDDFYPTQLIDQDEDDEYLQILKKFDKNNPSAEQTPRFDIKESKVIKNARNIDRSQQPKKNYSEFARQPNQGRKLGKKSVSQPKLQPIRGIQKYGYEESHIMGNTPYSYGKGGVYQQYDSMPYAQLMSPSYAAAMAKYGAGAEIYDRAKYIEMQNRINEEKHMKDALSMQQKRMQKGLGTLNRKPSNYHHQLQYL